MEIFIIDDNPGDARLIEIMLAGSPLSCRCHIFNDLAGGIAAVKKRPPAIVLLDLGLPDSRGIETLERFLAASHSAPVVVLSGNDDEQVAVSAVKKGAQDYLIKGRVDEELLARTIRYAIERDIAARRLAESESRYRDLFDNAHDLIMAVDREGRFLYVNRSWERKMGYGKETIPDLRLDDILHPDTLARRDEIFFPFRPEDHSGGEIFTLLNAAGEEVIVEGELGAHFDENGSIVSVRAILHDITARKKAEEERERIQNQLMSAQKMEAIGTLAGGVAHDFNNILTVIQGFADLGINSLDNRDKLVHHFDSIKKSCTRAAAIVRQLLLFSRKQVMAFKALSPVTVVTEITELLGRLIGEDIEMRLDLSPMARPVLGDNGSLEQVLVNLVVNARDAMDGHGVLDIRVDEVEVDAATASRYRNGRTGRFVELSVRDNGCGMDSEVLSRAFEPFFTTKELGRGTGLGLAVAFGIIEQHRGWIGIDSRAGKGTTVRVFLPVLEDSAVVSRQGMASEKRAIPLGRGERVLMVEDEEILREVTRDLLNNNGYRASAAACAAAALDLIREKRQWDVFFSDVVLPDMNGIKLAEQVRKLSPDTRIILTSGYADDKSRRALIRQKDFSFLPKPYSAEELLICLAPPES